MKKTYHTTSWEWKSQEMGHEAETDAKTKPKEYANVFLPSMGSYYKMHWTELWMPTHTLMEPVVGQVIHPMALSIHSFSWPGF